MNVINADDRSSADDWSMDIENQPPINPSDPPLSTPLTPSTAIPSNPPKSDCINNDGVRPPLQPYHLFHSNASTSSLFSSSAFTAAPFDNFPFLTNDYLTPYILRASNLPLPPYLQPPSKQNPNPPPPPPPSEGISFFPGEIAEICSESGLGKSSMLCMTALTAILPSRSLGVPLGGPSSPMSAVILDCDARFSRGQIEELLRIYLSSCFKSALKRREERKNAKAKGGVAADTDHAWHVEESIMIHAVDMPQWIEMIVKDCMRRLFIIPIHSPLELLCTIRLLREKNNLWIKHAQRERRRMEKYSKFLINDRQTNEMIANIPRWRPKHIIGGVGDDRKETVNHAPNTNKRFPSTNAAPQETRSIKRRLINYTERRGRHLEPLTNELEKLSDEKIDDDSDQCFDYPLHPPLPATTLSSTPPPHPSESSESNVRRISVKKLTTSEHAAGRPAPLPRNDNDPIDECIEQRMEEEHTLSFTDPPRIDEGLLLYPSAPRKVKLSLNIDGPNAGRWKDKDAKLSLADYMHPVCPPPIGVLLIDNITAFQNSTRFFSSSTSSPNDHSTLNNPPSQISSSYAADMIEKNHINAPVAPLFHSSFSSDPSLILNEIRHWFDSLSRPMLDDQIIRTPLAIVTRPITTNIRLSALYRTTFSLEDLGQRDGPLPHINYRILLRRKIATQNKNKTAPLYKYEGRISQFVKRETENHRSSHNVNNQQLRITFDYRLDDMGGLYATSAQPMNITATTQTTASMNPQPSIHRIPSPLRIIHPNIPMPHPSSLAPLSQFIAPPSTLMHNTPLATRMMR